MKRLALLVLAALPLTPAADAAPACPATGQTLGQKSGGRLYLDAGAVYGCWDGAGRVHRLDVLDREILLPRVAGRFAAYVLRGPGFTAVRLADLDTGASTTFVPPAPPPELTPPEHLNDGEVHSLVVGPFGNVAWIGSHNAPYEVHHGDLAQRDRLLDAGYEIDPGSLAVQNGRLRWTNAGRTRKGDLDGKLGDKPPLEEPRLRLVPGEAGPEGPGTAIWRYGIEVEDGIAIDRRAFGRAVDRILLDTRGWTGRGAHIALQRVDGPPFDFRVTLAKPRTTDRLCLPLHTGSRVSCQNRGRSVLNILRWTLGSPYWGPKARYREYLVNHEVGHSLGHHHRFCHRGGKPAPIMQQGTGPVAPCFHTSWPQPFERRRTAAP